MFTFLKNIGPTELIIIGVILVVFFGAKRISSLGKASGETLREVKKIKKEFSSAVNDVDNMDSSDEEEVKD